jgi:hypothetical protein
VGGVICGPIYLVALAGYGGAPRTTDVGYMPDQPVEFSHALHAGEMGMDCRYCHTTVEQAAFAAIPPTQTCWNCHGMDPQAGGNLAGPGIQWGSEKITPIKESHATGMPIEWVKVHDLPDYAYFNHAPHINAGVGCVECHGRIDRMEKVYQAETLSMSWCLDCHRNPDDRLRPVSRVTQMDWTINQSTEQDLAEIRQLRQRLPQQRQMTDCSTCHR